MINPLTLPDPAIAGQCTAKTAMPEKERQTAAQSPNPTASLGVSDTAPL
jgi:hypothetical protein